LRKKKGNLAAAAAAAGDHKTHQAAEGFIVGDYAAELARVGCNFCAIIPDAVAVLPDR
jgi:hypothetical protein